MPYSEEAKTQAVMLYHHGESVDVICEKFGIARSTLFRWAKQYQSTSQKAPHEISAREYFELKRRVTKLENMITILQSAGCTVNAPLKDRLAYLESLYGQYDVHTLCEAMNVDRGTFYNYIKRNKRDKAWYAKRREEFKVLVRGVFIEYHEVVGAEKICSILRERGYRTTPQYVSELMIEMRLSSVRNTSKKRASTHGPPATKSGSCQTGF